MIGFVVFTYHIFSSYSFWANLLIILWFSLIFHCLKTGLVPCPGDKLMVTDLTTREWVLLMIHIGRWIRFLGEIGLPCNNKPSSWHDIDENVIIFLSRLAILSIKLQFNWSGTYKWKIVLLDAGISPDYLMIISHDHALQFPRTLT